MSELLAFVRLGFGHITDPGALDHILFLLALAAIYRGREWRASVWVVSAFTVGHSITLALAVTGAVTLPTPSSAIRATRSTNPTRPCCGRTSAPQAMCASRSTPPGFR